MSSLDTRIDELYARPLGEFTAARNQLAKSLSGDDAARVKRLEKPTVVPWSVNQLFWLDRPAYEQLMAAGRALRSAQIRALKGHAADLRSAAAAHRAALSSAVDSATTLAAASGARPGLEPLSRMLEALSLASDPPATPGRYHALLQPAGFEALAGVTPASMPASPAAAFRPAPRDAGSSEDPPPPRPSKKAESAARRQAEEEAAAARKAAQAAVEQARRQLDRARATETRAQMQVDAARHHLTSTEATLTEARSAVERAERDLTGAERTRDTLT